MPIYPNVSVRLVGEDGNAFSILARVTTAMRRAGVRKDTIEDFRQQAMSGDYNNLLRTVMEWVAVDEDMDDYVDDEGEGCWNCGEGQHNCSCDDEDY